MTKSCQHCGDKMYMKEGDKPSKFKARKYCSHQCRSRAAAPKATGALIAKAKERKVVRDKEARERKLARAREAYHRNKHGKMTTCGLLTNVAARKQAMEGVSYG